MKFRDAIGRYSASPKRRSWRPSPSLLITVVSLMVLTGSIAWASDASVRLTATDDTTGSQSGINVLYKDTGNGDYAPAMVRADPNVGADAHVRLTGTNAQGQQTGVNVAYHDTGNGDYTPIFQEVNAQGTPIAGGGGGATPTPSCADLGGNCTFTSVAITGSQTDPPLQVAGLQPTPVSGATGTDARDVVHVVGGVGGATTSSAATTQGGGGGEIYMVSGDGGAPTNGATQYGGSGADNVWQSGNGASVTNNNATVEQDGGNAGTVTAQGGNGGSATSTGGSSNIGGGGGGFADYGGAGGSATNGTTNYGGTGGATNLNPGPGGNGATQGGNAGVFQVNGGNGGTGAAGGHGTDIELLTGSGGPTNGRAGAVDVTFGTADGTGATGKFTVQGKTEFDSAGRPVLSGCVLNAATPVAGSVLTASSATACSFVTPAAAAATSTPVATPTPAPPVAQSSFCDKGVTAGLTVSYVSVQCASSSATEANVQTAMAQAATIQNLYITTQGAQGGSGNLTIKFRKNGADTALTATVTAGAAAGVFSDTTHTFNAAAGDLIDFSQIDSGNATSAQWVASYQIANGVATGTCVLTSATPVAGTFLFAQSSNSCVWSTPTPRATATPQPAATLVPTATPEIHAAVTQNTPAAGTTLFFPGPQPTPGIYVTPTGGGGGNMCLTLTACSITLGANWTSTTNSTYAKISGFETPALNAGIYLVSARAAYAPNGSAHGADLAIKSGDGVIASGEYKQTVCVNNATRSTCSISAIMPIPVGDTNKTIQVGVVSEAFGTTVEWTDATLAGSTVPVTEMTWLRVG